MLSLLFISYLSNKVVCRKCWMSIFYCSEEARTSTQREWHRQRVRLGELFVCVCELFVNKVLKTVLHLSLLIIGPMVALMLAHRWPTGGPQVAQLACHMPLLGQRWPTGQNDVGPPVAANGGPTAGPPVAQRWATGGPTVACHCWANVGPPAKMTLAHRWLPTVAQRRSHRWPNVGPPGSCYLGCSSTNESILLIYIIFIDDQCPVWGFSLSWSTRTRASDINRHMCRGGNNLQEQ